jgi:hypothetical protein
MRRADLKQTTHPLRLGTLRQIPTYPGAAQGGERTRRPSQCRRRAASGSGRSYSYYTYSRGRNCHSNIHGMQVTVPPKYMYMQKKRKSKQGAVVRE